MKRSDFSGRKSKLREVANRDGEDRISSLPDAIISHILSFLPTKAAVATSVLSSRWKFIWTSVPNLCFDDRLFSECEDTPALTRFENFVNRVILLCDYSVNINKFSIICHKFSGLASLKFWVSYAITRRVRELELSINGYNNVELPDSICTSKTLEVLKLKSDFVFKVPSSGMCFPCVKVLHLEMLYPKNNMVEKLFTICPLLENLSIKGIIRGFGSVTKFNISSRTLKKLTINLEDYNDLEDKHQVVVRAPNLEHLHIRDNTPVPYVVHELHSLSKVVFSIVDVFMEDFDPPDADCVVQFLKGIANTKFLSLCVGSMSALECALRDVVPAFPNLTHLEMTIADLGCRVFPIILSSAPKLEAFVLDQKLDADFGWIEPPCVPICLLSHTKKIEIKGFNGMENQLQMIRYLLKHSVVLNTMIIELLGKWSRRKGSREKLRRILVMFEKGSPTCKILVA